MSATHKNHEPIPEEMYATVYLRSGAVEDRGLPAGKTISEGIECVNGYMRAGIPFGTRLEVPDRISLYANEQKVYEADNPLLRKMRSVVEKGAITTEHSHPCVRCGEPVKVSHEYCSLCLQKLPFGNRVTVLPLHDGGSVKIVYARFMIGLAYTAEVSYMPNGSGLWKTAGKFTERDPEGVAWVYNRVLGTACNVALSNPSPTKEDFGFLTHPWAYRVIAEKRGT